MVEADRPGSGEEGRRRGRVAQEEDLKPPAESDFSGGAPEALPPGAKFRLERFLGAAAMALLCLITLANVCVRYLTDISFAFTEEVSVFLLVFLTFVGSAKAFLDGNQVSVTYFIDRVGWTWRRRWLLFALAMSALMIGLLAWFGARMAWDDFDMEVTSPGLGWPQWVYTVWLPLLSLAVLARIAQGLHYVWGKKTP